MLSFYTKIEVRSKIIIAFVLMTTRIRELKIHRQCSHRVASKSSWKSRNKSSFLKVSNFSYHC